MDRCHAVALDNAGNIFITGFFNDTANFSMGTGTATLSSSGAQDIFIVKLDTAGNLLFANKIGGAGNESANAIATDADGNIIITGSFSGSVNFNTSGGSTVLSSTGYSDIFIAKYNAAGSLLWANAEGSAQTDAANAVCTTISGNIYVTGYFSDTADFDTGPGQQFLSSNGGIDMFVQKFDANGNFNWVKNMGGIGTEEGLGIAADNLENVYTTGRFNKTVDFDPDTGIYDLVSNGNSDVFIQKLNTSLFPLDTRV